MKKHVLFIQGGGDKGYEADAVLVESLSATLGGGYEMHYPLLQTNESVSDFGWPQQIGEAINKIDGDVILVGHSLGASLILKYLSEANISKKINGVFLLATPFWSGEEEWVNGLKLRNGFADRLPADVPVFFYHSKDDKEVPVGQLSLYAEKLPRANIREVKEGGHQFNNDLGFLALDIKGL